MNIDFFKRLLLFLVLLLAQVLVLNHIHLFGCATPLLYVYFVISFQRGYPRWAILLYSFLLGLCLDIFSNTPGVATTSMTLLGFLQPYLIELFMQREDDENFQPAISTMGPAKFFYYSLLLTLVYCVVFFALETFSFFNWLQWVLSVVGSFVLSELLLFVVDGIRKK
jgi:rod shape-determining protein MreD